MLLFLIGGRCFSGGCFLDCVRKGGWGLFVVDGEGVVKMRCGFN